MIDLIIYLPIDLLVGMLNYFYTHTHTNGEFSIDGATYICTNYESGKGQRDRKHACLPEPVYPNAVTAGDRIDHLQ